MSSVLAIDLRLKLFFLLSYLSCVFASKERFMKQDPTDSGYSELACGRFVSIANQLSH